MFRSNYSICAEVTEYPPWQCQELVEASLLEQQQLLCWTVLLSFLGDGDCAEAGRGMGPGSGGREKPAHAQRTGLSL